MTLYRSIFLMSFLAIAVGLTAWISFTYFNTPQLKLVRQENLPDAIMEGVHALILDKNGKPSMNISTPKLVYYTHSDETHFTLPVLTLFHQSSQPWKVSADNAMATSGMDFIHFKKNVAIHHAADEAYPATSIKTQHLLVNTLMQTAETNDLITLTQPNISMNAVGMKANINTGHIQLLSQAKGEYLPDA